MTKFVEFLVAAGSGRKLGEQILQERTRYGTAEMAASARVLRFAQVQARQRVQRFAAAAGKIAFRLCDCRCRCWIAMLPESFGSP